MIVVSPLKNTLSPSLNKLNKKLTKDLTTSILKLYYERLIFEPDHYSEMNLLHRLSLGYSMKIKQNKNKTKLNLYFKATPLPQ